MTNRPVIYTDIATANEKIKILTARIEVLKETIDTQEKRIDNFKMLIGVLEQKNQSLKNINSLLIDKSLSKFLENR